MIFFFYYLIENYANFNFGTHGTSEQRINTCGSIIS